MTNNIPQQASQIGNLTLDLTIKLEEAATGKIEALRVPRLEMCEACGGTGESWREDDGTCAACESEGWMKRFKSLEVRIPAGIETGTRLRIAGEGEVEPSSLARGDLYLTVRVLEHELFKRKGKNLYSFVTVTQEQLANGAEVFVSTLLDGDKRLHVPPATVDGATFRLAGLGLRSIESSERGDLFVKLRTASKEVNVEAKAAPSTTAAPSSRAEKPQAAARHLSPTSVKALAAAFGVLVLSLTVITWNALRSRSQPQNQNATARPSPSARPTATLAYNPTPTSTYTPPPSPSSAPFSLPNGSDIIPPQGPRGNNTLRIINGGDFDVAVKIVNSSTRKTRRFVYVRANSTAVIKNVVREICDMLVFSGTDWDKETRQFLSDQYKYKFDQTFDFRKIRYTVNLKPTLGGTLRSVPISDEEFEDK